LVADRIPLAASLPAHPGPLVPDGTVDREGARGGRPVDGAAVGEVVEPTPAAGSPGLVGDGIAEEAPLPTQAGPLGPDGTVDRPRTRGGRPVDRAAVGEVVDPTPAVGDPG